MRRVATLASVMVAAMSVASAVAGDVSEVATEARLELGLEASLLVELGSWPSELPVEITDEYEFNEEFFAGLTRVELLEWLDEVDRSNAEMLAAVRAAGAPVAPDLAVALGPLPPEGRRAVQEGRMLPIQPAVYRRALTVLTHLRVGPPTHATAGGPAASTAAAVGATFPSGTAPAADADAGVDVPAPAPGPSGTRWIPSLVMAAAAVATVWLVRRRRPGTRTGEPASLDRLLDAGRRMTAALDRTQVGVIARSESVAVTEARFGAFLVVDGDDISVGSADPGLFHEECLTEGVLARAAATGQTQRLVCRDEPALSSLPVSLLAAPVIGQGRVVGLLTVVRDAGSPFVEAEQHALEQLAPMVGSAVAAAGRHRDVTELSEVDALTGLANRRRFDVDIAAFAGATTPFGLAMIDVDHFKVFNDTNGHAAGDVALRTVASVIRGSLREEDRAYRYGGEEFAVLFSASSPDGVARLVERARRAVESTPVPGEENQPGGRLTISVGVFSGLGLDPDQAVRMADAALYRAKDEGRNRVVVDRRLPRSA